MPENPPEKVKEAADHAKQAAEHAKEAIDREDDKIDQVAQKAEPHLHEAGERWAAAEVEAAHPDEHKHR